MLHHWITDFNEYQIFCDYKVNREKDQLHVLKKCLSFSNMSAKIVNLQAWRSNESVLIQLADVLTGVAATKLNGLEPQSQTKKEIIAETERRLGREITHTYRNEHKFNVFPGKKGEGYFRNCI